LDAGASPIVDANHRCAVPQRQIHHLRHLLPHHLGEGAAEHGEVLGEDIDGAPFYLAPPGDDGVAEVFLLGHTELRAAVEDQLVEFLEATLV
jgi:hypothetical protein